MRGAHRPLLLVVYILLSLAGARTQTAKGCFHFCPRNSECVDEKSCRCKSGFTSSEELINISGSCDDINECLQQSVTVTCGPFATCQNSEGSYHCVCNQGYKLVSGKKSFANRSENTCEASVDTGVTPAPSGIHTVATVPENLPKQQAAVHPWTQPGDPGEKTSKGRPHSLPLLLLEENSWCLDPLFGQPIIILTIPNYYGSLKTE